MEHGEAQKRNVYDRKDDGPGELLVINAVFTRIVCLVRSLLEHAGRNERARRIIARLVQATALLTETRPENKSHGLHAQFDLSRGGSILDACNENLKLRGCIVSRYGFGPFLSAGPVFVSSSFQAWRFSVVCTLLGRRNRRRRRSQKGCVRLYLNEVHKSAVPQCAHPTNLRHQRLAVSPRLSGALLC